MTVRYVEALALAAKAHDGQFRKGTGIPYISHPVAVAALVAQYGGEEDQQIGGLFHDILEDAGPSYEPEIRRFGEKVLAIVQGCTDGMPDTNNRKPPWKQRKLDYLAHLASASDDVILVSCCDKLANARAILDDLVEIGPAVFDRFTAAKSETLWYYRELASVFKARGCPVAVPLERTVHEILRRSE